VTQESKNMRIQVLLASAATALALSCGASSAAPTVAGDADTAKGQNADRGIVLAQRGGGGGGGARFSGGGGGGRAAIGGGGGGARFYGGGAAAPRFYGRGGGARFSEAGTRVRVVGQPPRRWQGAANWRRNWRPGYGGGYYPYYGYGWGWGLGYGLGWGYGWGYPYYGDTYYYDAPVVYSGGGGDVAYCAQRFKSYDPRSGTYLGYDGKRHPCP
jgi:hypothetical protein